MDEGVLGGDVTGDADEASPPMPEPLVTVLAAGVLVADDTITAAADDDARGDLRVSV